MTDRIRTEIESDSEKTEVKKANSVGDEILEYTIFSMPQMAPTHRSSQCTMAMLPIRTITNDITSILIGVIFRFSSSVH